MTSIKFNNKCSNFTFEPSIFNIQSMISTEKYKPKGQMLSYFRNINIYVRCKQWRKGHLSSSWAYLHEIVGNLFKIVTVASLESVLPIELLATHRYFCGCSVSLVKTSNSIETLPFWTTVPFLTDELLFNHPMTGLGKPFASQDKFTVTTLASR